MQAQFDRLLSKRKVKEIVGYSYAQIDRLEDAGDFPKRVVLWRDKNDRPTRVAWSEAEILAYVQKILRRRQPVLE